MAHECKDMKNSNGLHKNQVKLEKNKYDRSNGMVLNSTRVELHGEEPTKELLSMAKKQMKEMDG